MPISVDKFKIWLNERYLNPSEYKKVRELMYFLNMGFKHHVSEQEFFDVINYIFCRLCSSSLEIVKYLILFSPNKELIDISYNNYFSINILCCHNQLEILKFINKNKKINIHIENYYPIRSACAHGHLEMVEFLLTSPDLKEHGDIHAQEDYGLIQAYLNQHTKLVDYLIFDYHIELTQAIERYIEEETEIFGTSQLKNLFEKRELNKALKNTLSNKNVISNIVKI